MKRAFAVIAIAFLMTNAGHAAETIGRRDRALAYCIGVFIYAAVQADQIGLDDQIGKAFRSLQSKLAARMKSSVGDALGDQLSGQSAGKMAAADFFKNDTIFTTCTKRANGTALPSD